MSKTTHYLGILALVMAVVLSVAGSPLLAQISTATIEGTVSDSTGAVLPGVEVTLTNLDNGQTRLAISGDEGRYTSAQLASGNYEVRAELAGFQAGVRLGLRLLVGQRAVVNFTMEIGSISEEVVVTGEAAMVNTTSSTLSEHISEVQVHNLPLNSRNLVDLSLLTPGVVKLQMAPSGGVIQGAAGTRVSVAGARIYQTGYILDGSDVTDAARGVGIGGAAGGMFGVETVKEFQVITNNFSAEYARFSGGVMSMITKSGTNAFHGSAFWFHRNDNFDASNFFTNSSANLDKPEFKRHQFGATIGGPVVEDKAFFFFSYEGFREDLGQSLIGQVPTVEVKNGLFPAPGGACGANEAALGGVYNAGLNRCVITPHPDAQAFVDLYPDPTGATLSDGIRADLAVNESQVTTEDFITARLDLNLTDSDSFFGRFTMQDGGKDLAQDGQRSFIASAQTTVANTNLYSTLEWKHIFSPNTINTVRVGAQRNAWDEDCTTGGPLNIGFFPDRCMGFVSVDGGHLHLGNWVVGQNINNHFDYSDDMFLTRGRHDIKLGVVLTRQQTNDFVFAAGDGRFNFDSMAHLLVGIPDQWDGKVPQDEPQRGARQWIMGFYVQDDFKWSPTLTVNLGVRYEPSWAPTEVNGLLGNIRGDPTTATEPTIGEPYYNSPSMKNFAPRLGVAWDPFGDGKTSVRMGAGIFHDTILPYHYSNQIRRSVPFAVQPTIRDDASLAAQFPNAPLEALTAPPGTQNPQVAEFNPSSPYIAQWNLSLQREVATGLTLTASYVGSKGTHIQIQRNVNERVPEILPDGRKLWRSGLPDRNPVYADIDHWEFSSDSHYNGLQFGLRKRFADGFQFQAAYTFGRSTDIASSINQSDIQENTSKNPPDAYDVRLNKGLSDHHVQNNFVFNYVYELPSFGFDGAAKHVLEGWQINGIISLSTGNPLKLLLGTGANLRDYDRNGENSGGAQHPSLASGASANPVLADGRDPQQYYDPNAFTLHNPGFLGSVGRNTLIVPGVATVDFSLFKNTALAEDVNLQFRAEFFNILNRANFGTPSRNVFSAATVQDVDCGVYGSTGPSTGCSELISSTYSATAGRITASRTTSRQIQFGLRLIF